MASKYLTIAKISDGLSTLGIEQGDVVMVHSAFSTIEAVENGAEGVIRGIESLIGVEGTLVMPVFNWDILHMGDEIVYDVRHTPSKMGYLTEYFRKRKGSTITRNLFNPLAVKGRLSDELLNCPNNTSWGDDSPFRILYDNNALILMIGVDYNVVTMFHVAETMFGVSYRFLYEFPNAFWIDGSGEKTPLKNTTLRRHDGYPTDFNIAEAVFRDRDLIREIELGDSITRATGSRALVDCVIGELKRDENFLIKKSPARKWVRSRKKGVFYVKDFVYELWLKNRTLVSDDYDWSLERISEYVPLEISSYPTSMQAWDWTIPEKWVSKGGTIRSMGGEVIVDLDAHPLHIAAGSVPFSGEIEKEELLRHVKTDPDRPDAIPYATLYYDRDWAVCIPHEWLEKFKEERYVVDLNCRRTDGELKIGQYILPGETEDSIVFPLHLDHPGQCNDNLSGIATAIALIQKLENTGKRFRYTLRFIFLPETIGAITYLSQNEDLIPLLKWGIVFDSVGTIDELMFMKSRDGDTPLDICTKLAFMKKEIKHKEFSFLEIEGYGNDERIFQAPGVDIPSISIARFPFKEYHSSLDNPDIISPKSIEEVRDLVLDIIEMLDLDFQPVRKYSGIPQLSKMKTLEREFLRNTQTKRAIQRFFFLIDGKKYVSEIALETGMTFDFTYRVFTELEKKRKNRVSDVRLNEVWAPT